MTTLTQPRALRTASVELHSGDRMTRAEFHRAYEQTPEDFRAELIGGIVYVPSPLRLPHGTIHPPFSSIFFAYEAATPGVECGDNTTVMLGEKSEPQPDLYMRILPEYGGQSSTSPDDYVKGAPELIAEIAHSSRAIDLHAKLEDYRRHAVLEYLVVCLDERQVRWFDFRSGQEPSPDPDGIARIRTIPGLWIHAEALLARDYTRLMAALNAGLATAEHTDFVKRLAAARRPTTA